MDNILDLERTRDCRKHWQIGSCSSGVDQPNMIPSVVSSDFDGTQTIPHMESGQGGTPRALVEESSKVLDRIGLI